MNAEADILEQADAAFAEVLVEALDIREHEPAITPNGWLVIPWCWRAISSLTSINCAMFTREHCCMMPGKLACLMRCC